MQSVRCSQCSRLLCHADFIAIEIKCPRCKHIERAESSLKQGVTHVPSTIKNAPNRPVDRREAPISKTPATAIP
ncbi:Com family DNA-binding transcriptional regulator [Thalassolituus oleivorans]|uniref:Com family DNA-binding transcriptional regulator n=1 Tax=Thalassolituus oleivorans TaxID=187493 RepID=UPI0023F529BB|nr:Com family DNA-binding transcriptional regulator [Thalassolituus oleivorans]